VPRPPAARRYHTDKQERAFRRLLAAVDAERQRLASQRDAAALPPLRERIIGRWVFEVVWDGRRGSPMLTG
jgi:hypothetical protein